MEEATGTEPSGDVTPENTPDRDAAMALLELSSAKKRHDETTSSTSNHAASTPPATESCATIVRNPPPPPPPPRRLGRNFTTLRHWKAPSAGSTAESRNVTPRATSAPSGWNRRENSTPPNGPTPSLTQTTSPMRVKQQADGPSIITMPDSWLALINSAICFPSSAPDSSDPKENTSPTGPSPEDEVAPISAPGSSDQEADADAPANGPTPQEPEHEPEPSELEISQISSTATLNNDPADGDASGVQSAPQSSAKKKKKKPKKKPKKNRASTEPTKPDSPEDDSAAAAAAAAAPAPPPAPNRPTPHPKQVMISWDRYIHLIGQHFQRVRADLAVVAQQLQREGRDFVQNPRKTSGFIMTKLDVDLSHMMIEHLALDHNKIRIASFGMGWSERDKDLEAAMKKVDEAIGAMNGLLRKQDEDKEKIRKLEAEHEAAKKWADARISEG
jgi:hypothetical protein